MNERVQIINGSILLLYNDVGSPDWNARPNNRAPMTVFGCLWELYYLFLLLSIYPSSTEGGSRYASDSNDAGNAPGPAGWVRGVLHSDWAFVSGLWVPAQGSCGCVALLSKKLTEKVLI